MTDASRYCRGCGDEFRITEEQIDRALAMLVSDPDGCVPDETYDARLAVCGSCVKLQGGMTCLADGSLIRIAAKMKAWSCPMSFYSEESLTSTS